MDLIRSWGAELGVALACGAWVAVFVAEPEQALLLGPATVVAVLPFRRRPLPAGAAAVAYQLLAWSAGVPLENPALLAPLLVVAFALRRYDTSAWGLVLLAGGVAAVVARQPTVANLLFVGLLVGGTAAFGAAVRRRDDDARAAAATAAELRDRDPAETARRVVAEERARLAGETLDVVRQAVLAMRRHAGAAEQSLATADLEAVGTVGRRAVTELRRLLGLLRQSPEPRPPEEPAGSRNRPRRRRLDVGGAAVLAALAALETTALEATGRTGVLGPLLAAAVCCCVALRRVDAAVACLLAALPPGVAMAAGVPLPGTLSTVLAWALLSWSAGADGRRWSLAALTVLAGATTADTFLHASENVAVTVATFAVPAVAGLLWMSRDHAGRTAEAAATTLEAAQRSASTRAVQAERQRLARELHDVVSHAISVMVVQAGAALALRTSEPARARQAVRAVADAGTRALAELDVLFGLLDGGAAGAEGHALPARPPGLARALGELSARIEGAGVTVRLRVPEDLPTDDAVAESVHRVAQEALTNAVRYAPGSRVEVTVDRAGDRLTVTVVDDGPRSRPPASSSSGFGLVGLTERVRALGGELVAGPEPSGGFRVAATMPVPSSRAGVRP
ncbi:sensor histidine kinase [Blastococcus sp. SYSU DS0973]